MKTSYANSAPTKKGVAWLSLALSLLACIASCSPREQGNLGSIPSTFTGTLEVQPHGRMTKDLYQSIVKLAESYGMNPQGDGATDGKQWQIQILCGDQYVGGGTTASDGDLVMFQLAIYGFREPQHYERFKAEMLEQMSAYGELSSLKEHPPIGEAELKKRGEHAGFDVTSKCGPG